VIRGALGQRLSVIVANLLEVGIRVTESRSRKYPVKVRVRELTDVAAGETFIARRTVARAEYSLSKP
jgi:hypothetical protein